MTNSISFDKFCLKKFLLDICRAYFLRQVSSIKNYQPERHKSGNLARRISKSAQGCVAKNPPFCNAPFFDVCELCNIIFRECKNTPKGLNRVDANNELDYNDFHLVWEERCMCGFQQNAAYSGKAERESPPPLNEAGRPCRTSKDKC